MALSSCHDEVTNPNKELTLEAFSDLKTNEYKLNSHRIRNLIDQLIRDDGTPFAMDKRVRKYYSDRKPFIWINRLGVRSNADTLLTAIKNADCHGLSTKMLRASQIEKDIKAIRNLDVIGTSDNINMIMARLEYNLTRAYFRYSAGLNFGFVSPDYLYNHYEVSDSDSVSVTYARLSDLKTMRADDTFYANAVSKAFSDSLPHFLASVVPSGALYKLLLERLNNGNLSKDERLKTHCNIERCRWKFKNMSNINQYDKYVVVNIPSFSLRAVKDGNIMTMRVACGTMKSKTPLLNSNITKMNVNPQWIVPKSIAKGIAHNYGYMHKMGMFVYDKQKGKLPPEASSYSKIMEGKQFIIQAGGPNNSLGRIIFRFNNNFSVFLHDTSSPWLFKRSQRDVSHGCIRVERPLDLALFMLNDGGGDYEKKLRYSMTVDLVDEEGNPNDDIDKSLLVSSVKVNPEVPLFITYYTVYYNANGQLIDYDDVYGYDDVLIDELTPFIE